MISVSVIVSVGSCTVASPALTALEDLDELRHRTKAKCRCAFQDTVRMVLWNKKNGWSRNKQWDGCPKRIDKFSIHKRDQAKVRNFVYRFQEDG